MVARGGGSVPCSPSGRSPGTGDDDPPAHPVQPPVPGLRAGPHIRPGSFERWVRAHTHLPSILDHVFRDQRFVHVRQDQPCPHPTTGEGSSREARRRRDWRLAGAGGWIALPPVPGRACRTDGWPVYSRTNPARTQQPAKDRHERPGSRSGNPLLPLILRALSRRAGPLVRPASRTVGCDIRRWVSAYLARPDDPPVRWSAHPPARSHRPCHRRGRWAAIRASFRRPSGGCWR